MTACNVTAPGKKSNAEAASEAFQRQAGLSASALSSTDVKKYPNGKT